MTRYRDLGARDAIHAAVVLTNGLEGIVSADKVFKSIIEIRAWDPTEEI
jgi:predicted nucleic acid-binding protein